MTNLELAIFQKLMATDPNSGAEHLAHVTSQVTQRFFIKHVRAAEGDFDYAIFYANQEVENV